ncbi:MULTISPECIES: maleylpyruvate isomerase family mycothiol-dependent enzyme [unclassified Streptomyces]|uniref:maleylpyruvate isomerase family mycothiol-dependent enzyme n=1 Tax=unclassified Streptomyces TaxID=2593676 RepID=UPI002E0D4ADA|nr:maleylpyruvate isomerase family mycothiol-dependent enzyme [Streptomyces sp. NBC_01197]WSS47878.1 maleylpyruvate isomerase family mycothiol-dependent enzyme [Streptomyces sp. NBC_01180]
MKEIAPTQESFQEIAAAADRLMAGLAGLRDRDVPEPSRLPGWTRGHVLSHLARQAPALERLLEWARTGVETPQYPDRRARDAEIEAGAGRPAAVQLADVRESAAHFQQVIETLPAAAWQATVRPFTGELCTPQRILVIRLRELELHHVDLDIGYGWDGVPASARQIILADVLGYYAEAEGVPDFTLRDTGGDLLGRFGTGGPAVTGTSADALAWLAGRSGGTGLTSTAALPVLPPWL